MMSNFVRETESALFEGCAESWAAKLHVNFDDLVALAVRIQAAGIERPLAALILAAQITEAGGVAAYRGTLRKDAEMHVYLDRMEGKNA